METKEELIDKIAKEIMEQAHTRIMVSLRFLNAAISSLELKTYTGTLSVDGRYICYNPKYIIKLYKEDSNLPVRSTLHMILHCIFQHYFVNGLVEHDYWSISCDIAAEAVAIEIIDSLKENDNHRTLETKHDGAIRLTLDDIKSNTKYLTAEKIYRYFLEHPFDDGELEEFQNLFSRDNHDNWYNENSSDEQEDNEEEGDSSNQGDVSQGTGNSKSNTDQMSNETSENGLGESAGELNADDLNSMTKDELAKMWKDIADYIKGDLESFSKKQGHDSGTLMQNIRTVTREKYDYTEFLKKFATMHETMKINDDEFDYIFYTYGLEHYDNTPLIEPLEYKEVKKIKDFVIAIDTSGSVSGELVQKFVNKTYNILKNEESFEKKFNLRIIQCDTSIQEDVKITTQEEFDYYIKHMTLKGFGGTDFRPVFSYVNELIKNQEFTNLKGLIYFTDGYGAFPYRKQSYETAFVFVDDNYNNPDVPPWAIKLVLQSEDLKNL